MSAWCKARHEQSSCDAELGRWTRFVRFSPSVTALLCGQPREKRRPCHHQAHMPVPAVPGAGLTMIEPQIILGAQKAFLDRPTQPSCCGKLGKRCAGRSKGEVIGHCLWIMAACCASASSARTRSLARFPAAGEPSGKDADLLHLPLLHSDATCRRQALRRASPDRSGCGPVPYLCRSGARSGCLALKGQGAFSSRC